jgi:hypothetical protein|tara:strand:- start:1718 stop:2140 length:423 start_codon:yes stop_codon:yes gene_type:complete
MKKLIAMILWLASSLGYADSSSMNLNLPSSPQSYASDRIRAGQLDCQNAIGSSTNVEFGVVGFIDNNSTNPYNDAFAPTIPTTRTQDVGVYARITIPIGGPKERINCNTLYQLELEKKRMEVMKLKQEINNLKALQFAKE